MNARTIIALQRTPRCRHPIEVVGGPWDGNYFWVDWKIMRSGRWVGLVYHRDTAQGEYWYRLAEDAFHIRHFRFVHPRDSRPRTRVDFL